MTHRALYLWARGELDRAGIEDPGHEALLLAGHAFGLDRAGLTVHGEESPAPAAEEAFRSAVARRTERLPLQYLLGAWDFMGLTLAVGEGALCPREDTAVLVEAAARALEALPEPVGADLCAGTGAVGLGLCSKLPGARVTCVELSPQAMGYLQKNLAAYPRYRVTARQGDVLAPETAAAFPPESLDFLLANPPYIPRGELAALPPEVRREPALALDGGEDGLVFYREICRLWLPYLKPGGLLGVEIGEEQGAAVEEIFRESGLVALSLHRDLAGLDRAVLARKP